MWNSPLHKNCVLPMALLLLLVMGPVVAGAQNMSINSDGSFPDPSSMLDVASPTRGVLIPRTDTATVNGGGVAVATGLLIYQSANNTFYVYDGAKWIGIHGVADDRQTIDQFQLTGTTLSLSVENDDEAPKAVDLSSINSDDQTIDVLNLNGTNLEISLEDDAEATKSLDLSSLQAISEIKDANQDTRVTTEKTTDDNLIRFELNGTERFRMDGAKLLTLNSGRSVFIGENAGIADDLSDNRNVLIGYSSGSSITSGFNNIAIGFECLRSVTTGTSNIAIGMDAGELSTGSSNVFVGFRAGQQNTAGSMNVFLGHGAGRFETGSDRLYIEASSSTSPLIYGEFDNDVLQINGTLSVTDDLSIYNNKVLNLYSGSGSGLTGFLGAGLNDDITLESTGGWLRLGATNSSIAFFTDGNAAVNSNPQVVIDTTGKVGIGTSAPSTDLDVNGTVRFRGGTPVAGYALMATDGDGNATWSNPNQTIDVINLNGTNLELSLEDDGEATKVLDLSTIDTDTDNQTIDVLNLNGTNLEISLEDDAEATKTVNLGPINTDNQKIDVLSLSGTTLQLSLEEDAEATKTLNLSSLQAISQIRDGDNDTRVRTEQNTDEDVIRFALGGTEYFQMNSGRLETYNTGGSVFIGEDAGENDDFGSNKNVFIGLRAGENNVSGGSCIAIGAEALRSQTSGNSNIAIGADAGETNNGGQNLFIGFRAGQLNSGGSNNIFLGYRAGHFEGGSNRLYIDPSSTSSPLIYGEFDNHVLRVNGSLEVTEEVDLFQAEGYHL